MAGNKKILETTGHSIDDDDMRWSASCPQCEREFEFTGFFDSEDVHVCSCGHGFRITRIYFEDGNYLGKE